MKGYLFPLFIVTGLIFHLIALYNYAYDRGMLAGKAAYTHEFQHERDRFKHELNTLRRAMEKRLCFDRDREQI